MTLETLLLDKLKSSKFEVVYLDFTDKALSVGVTRGDSEVLYASMVRDSGIEDEKAVERLLYWLDLEHEAQVSGKKKFEIMLDRAAKEFNLSEEEMEILNEHREGS